MHEKHVAIGGDDTKLVQPPAPMLLQLLANDLALNNGARLAKYLLEGFGVAALYSRPCAGLIDLAIEVAGQMVAVSGLPSRSRQGEKHAEQCQW